MSAFHRIIKKGKQNVKTTPQTQALLCELSDKNHAAIAKVIAQWLEQTNKTNDRNN